MTDKPTHREFGKRRPRPARADSPPPAKRSGHVALLLMGTLAVGGGAYALMPRDNCQPASPGMAAGDAATPNASRADLHPVARRLGLVLAQQFLHRRFFVEPCGIELRRFGFQFEQCARAAASARLRMPSAAFLRRLTVRRTNAVKQRLSLASALAQVMETPGRPDSQNTGIATMKRSRRVVLTLMGSAAVGAVSMGLVPRGIAGPGNEAVPGPAGKPYCRPTYGGFGGTPRPAAWSRPRRPRPWWHGGG